MPKFLFQIKFQCSNGIYAHDELYIVLMAILFRAVKNLKTSIFFEREITRRISAVALGTDVLVLMARTTS